MSIYTTFFLAEPEELLSGFSGWKLPLATPVRREFQHALTNELVTVETHEPEWLDEDMVEAPQYGVAAIGGSYADYLDGRLPLFVRGQRHWAAKNLTDIEIKPLLRITGVSTELCSPLYASPSTGAALQEFAVDFLPKLCAIDSLEVAQQWAGDMSTPEHTHSVTGIRLSHGWSLDDAMDILGPLVALANDASSKQRLYLLVEV